MAMPPRTPPTMAPVFDDDVEVVEEALSALEVPFELDVLEAALGGTSARRAGKDAERTRRYQKVE